MGILDKMKRNTKDEGDAPLVDATPVANTAAKKKKSAVKKAVTGASHGNAGHVLVRPMLSEKTTQQESEGQYTFVVTADATKPAIMRAVAEIYGVQPRRVNIINVEGKRKQFGRFVGKRSDWKKAIISLPKGQKIQIHEGV